MAIEMDAPTTTQELYDALVEHQELIVTVPKDSVKQVKNALAQYKVRIKSRATTPEEMEQASKRLSYSLVQGSECTIEELTVIQLHIRLGVAPQELPILDVQLPKEEL